MVTVLEDGATWRIASLDRILRLELDYNVPQNLFALEGAGGWNRRTAVPVEIGWQLLAITFLNPVVLNPDVLNCASAQ